VAEHVNYVEWHIHPFRAERWFEIWRPALDRALAFGASSCYLTRNGEDPLHFRQVTAWERREDFAYYNKPLLPVWHSVVIDASPVEALD
jgi:hypothetical protein